VIDGPQHLGVFVNVPVSELAAPVTLQEAVQKIVTLGAVPDVGRLLRWGGAVEPDLVAWSILNGCIEAGAIHVKVQSRGGGRWIRLSTGLWCSFERQSLPPVVLPELGSVPGWTADIEGQPLVIWETDMTWATAMTLQFASRLPDSAVPKLDLLEMLEGNIRTIPMSAATKELNAEESSALTDTLEEWAKRAADEGMIMRDLRMGYVRKSWRGDKPPKWQAARDALRIELHLRKRGFLGRPPES